MAKADGIQESLNTLEFAALQHSMLEDVLTGLGGDQCPDWVGVMQGAFVPVQAAIDRLGSELRRDVLPFLRDLDAANGGMGVMTPMATQKPEFQSTATRK